MRIFGDIMFLLRVLGIDRKPKYCNSCVYHEMGDAGHECTWGAEKKKINESPYGYNTKTTYKHKYTCEELNAKNRCLHYWNEANTY